MIASVPPYDRNNAARPWGMAAYVTLALISLVYLLMIGARPILAAPGMPHDDMLFVRLSAEMLAGNWMGAYDQLTLVKGPGYPMWLAATNWLGIPLQVAQGIVYLSAGWLVALGLGRLGVAAWLCLLLFVFYLFVPGSTATVTLRTLREGLYTPLVALTFGLMVWHFALRDAAFWRRPIVGILLGIVLCWLWITREEQPWLYPGLAAFALGSILVRTRDAVGRRSNRLIGDAVVLAAVAGAMIGGILIVAGINQRHYGVRDISEFRQPAQEAAYGAISRVIPDRYVPYVVAPTDVRQKLYAVSPAFAEMRPHLEGFSLNWIKHSCAMAGVSPCDNDYRVSHFIWALRDAAWLAGRFKSAPEAKGYWKTVALQINAACDAGKLKCLPRRTSMHPPYRSEFLGEALTAFWQLLIVGLQQTHIPRGELYAIGDTLSIDTIRQVTHAPLYPRGSHLFVLARVARAKDAVPKLTLDAPPERGHLLHVEWLPIQHDGTRDVLLETDCLAADCRLLVVTGDEVRLRLRLDELTPGAVIDATGVNMTILQRQRTAVPRVMSRPVEIANRMENLFTRFYRAALPPLGVVAIGFLLFSLIRAIATRHVGTLLALTVVALAFAVSRVALLAYMWPTALPGVNYHYLSPFYPTSVLFIALALIGGAGDLRNASLRRPAYEAPVEPIPS